MDFDIHILHRLKTHICYSNSHTHQNHEIPKKIPPFLRTPVLKWQKMKKQSSRKNICRAITVIQEKKPEPLTLIGWRRINHNKHHPSGFDRVAWDSNNGLALKVSGMRPQQRACPQGRIQTKAKSSKLGAIRYLKIGLTNNCKNYENDAKKNHQLCNYWHVSK